MRKWMMACCILFAFATFAQERDAVTINYGISRLKYNNTAAHAQQLDVKIRLPLRQWNKSVLAGMAGYKFVTLNGFPDTYTQTLHGFTLQGAWMYKFTNRKSITAFAQAGLFSDMKDISAKDFRYSAGLRYRYKHSDKLSTGWGLAYSRQFFGNQVIPFIDVDYRPDEHWSISGQFPVKPQVLYHINPKLSVGMELNGEAASYRLSASSMNNQFIQINQWTGLAKMEYRFAKYWELSLGVGKNFRQTYKRYDDASTTPWTIITIPIGKRPEPVEKIEGHGLQLRFGIAFSPFRN